MVAYASTLPIAARSTGTSFSATLAVDDRRRAAVAATTAAASAAAAGPAADVLLPQAAPATAVAPAAMRMRDRKQKRLNTVSSKLLEGTLIRVV